MQPSTVAAILAVPFTVLAQGPISFCKDSLCTDCPNSITQDGIGYPACVTYKTNDVFEGQGYEPNDAGGVTPFISFPEPGLQCAGILRSPVPASDPGCGRVQAASQHAKCESQVISDTFAMQFCCGVEDCKNAGVSGMDMARMGINQPSAIVNRRNVELGISTSQGIYLKRANGTIIEPLSIRELHPSSTSNTEESTPVKRDPSCTFFPKGDPAGYTQPAPNTQIVSPAVAGGGMGTTITITTERTQGWSSSFSLGLTFQEFSLGASFETMESISNSQAITEPVPAGQTGVMGFTAILNCLDATVMCDDGSSEDANACTPYNGPDGNLYGVYGIVTES